MLERGLVPMRLLRSLLPVAAILLIVFMRGLASASPQVTPQQAWDQYKNHIKQLKTKLPIPLTDYLTLINARISRQKLVYTFRISHDTMSFHAAQTSIEYDFCQRTNASPLLSGGMTIIYEYYDLKGRRLGQVSVQSCSNI